MKTYQMTFSIILLAFLFACQETPKSASNDVEASVASPQQYITVLGTAQDAGFPQIDCTRDCCKAYHTGEESKKLISSLGLVDHIAQRKYIFDATPDFTEQTHILKTQHLDNGHIVDGVFLTHAHIGHYTGLMYLGREAMGASKIPVYTMPKMQHYLEQNGPWSQLVHLENIALQTLKNDSTIVLPSQLKVTPFLVPHRDEFSETVGYRIEGSQKSALFIPDINKWEQWEHSIIEAVKTVDYAFLDATFFKNGEIPRPMSEVPHPFIEETIRLFEKEAMATKNKIHFIHFNHSNPALKETHRLKDSVQALGYHFAKEGEVYGL